MLMPLIVCLFSTALKSQELYELPVPGKETKWLSPENPSGIKGKAGMENKGAKGHACDWIVAGESKVLMDYAGAGVINRIWMTVIERSPESLRSMYIQMFWDDADRPAVSVPLGDFFGIGLGRSTAFQSALFSDPEGKSFNCYIPMPFNRRAKIVLVNASRHNQLLFYDINLSALKKHPKKISYFHACWSDNLDSKLGEDFDILPHVKGKGRFLGTNLSIIADKIYGDTWFGEGEVKVYLDGDSAYPTLAGTGTEDYVGSAWNLGPFAQLYQGAPIVDKEKKQFAFYRYHIPDPVYFNSDCRVSIQQMGGGGREPIRAIARAGGQLKPVTVMTAKKLIKLLEEPDYPGLFDDHFPADEWVNFYRLDYYSATAYFYLDRPENGLPPLAPLERRLKGIK
jgi:hypothetical protein